MAAFCHRCVAEKLGASVPCPHWPEVPVIDGILSFAPDLAQSDENYDPAMFQDLLQAEETYFWFTERRALLLWAFRRYFPEARSFLEVGCGPGFVLAGLAAENPSMILAGSELLTAGLARAAPRLPPNVALYQADARHLPFENEWDVIGAFDVIEHLAEDEAVLKQMYRACRKGGGIMLTVPQHQWLWSEADSAAHHVRRYHAEDLCRKVRVAGFGIRRHTSFISTILPLMALQRLHKSDKPYSLRDSFRISAFTNRVLALAVACDRYLISLGLDLPMGGSLLIVATKE